VEEPLYVPEESESEESVADVEEEEELLGTTFTFVGSILSPQVSNVSWYKKHCRFLHVNNEKQCMEHLKLQKVIEGDVMLLVSK